MVWCGVLCCVVVCCVVVWCGVVCCVFHSSLTRVTRQHAVGARRAVTKTEKQTNRLSASTSIRGCLVQRSNNSSDSVAGNGQLILARGGYLRLILLKASRADALITPEHCVLSLHRYREVHAAQFQHHVMPRCWATECEGCTIFHPTGMFVFARTCCTPSPR